VKNSKPIKFVASCLTPEQSAACESLGVKIVRNYACSYGEIKPGCVTDFSIHCFNSASLDVLKNLGVRRATLHPELNFAQIRDIKKCIDTEAIIYGKIPLMKIKNPPVTPPSRTNNFGGIITDRTGAKFFLHGNQMYNSVPVFLADKPDDIKKSGISHGRFIFTTESADDVFAVIKAYLHHKSLKINFTRGKFYSKV